MHLKWTKWNQHNRLLFVLLNLILVNEKREEPNNLKYVFLFSFLSLFFFLFYTWRFNCSKAIYTDKQLIHLFVLESNLYFYNSHKLPVCFPFSSFFTDPKCTPHIPHPLLYDALTTSHHRSSAHYSAIPLHRRCTIPLHRRCAIPCSTLLRCLVARHYAIPLRSRCDVALLEQLSSGTSSSCFYISFFSDYQPLKLEPLNSICFMNVCVWFLFVSLFFAITPCLEAEFCDYFQVGYRNWLKIEFWVLIFSFFFFFCVWVLEC